MKFSGKKITFAIACTVMAACVFGAAKVPVPAMAASYDMAEMLAPVWEGTTSYKESVLVVKEKDGSIAPIELLYPIEEIISVENASLNKTYTKGVDYDLADGKLIINAKKAIPSLTYGEFHPTTGTDGFESRDGGYVCWKEGSWYHQRQIVVTYTHKEGYGGYIPEGKGKLLPRTIEKLKGDKLNILVYGDSISTGGNSSGHPQVNVAPYMPIYPDMFAEGIKLKYGVSEVNVYNASVGGTDSAWGLSNLRAGVLDKYNDIDLVILAFGMNDVTRDPDSYANNVNRMVKGLRTKYKEADVLLVAPMLPNYDAVKFYGQQCNFHTSLMNYEAEGTAVVNVTKLHEGVLGVKRYADLTGNNVNHANDYLARLYAQACLKTLEVSDYDLAPDEPEPPEQPEQPGNSSSPIGDSGSSSDEKGKSDGGCGGAAATTGIAGAIALAAALLNKKRK